MKKFLAALMLGITVCTFAVTGFAAEPKRPDIVVDVNDGTYDYTCLANIETRSLMACIREDGRFLTQWDIHQVFTYRSFANDNRESPGGDSGAGAGDAGPGAAAGDSGAGSGASSGGNGH